MRVPEPHPGLLEGSPDRAVGLVEVLADAFTGPAVGIEADGLGGLLGCEAPGAADAGVSNQLGHRGAVHLKLSGKLESSLSGEVAVQQFGLLRGREAMLGLFGGRWWWIRLSAGQVQQFLELP